MMSAKIRKIFAIWTLDKVFNFFFFYPDPIIKRQECDLAKLGRFWINLNLLLPPKQHFEVGAVFHNFHITFSGCFGPFLEKKWA
jgi:hypothetical protein